MNEEYTMHWKSCGFQNTNPGMITQFNAHMIKLCNMLMIFLPIILFISAAIKTNEVSGQYVRKQGNKIFLKAPNERILR